MSALGMNGAFAMMQARLSQNLPPEDRMDASERACRRRARDAEWNFRVSKGYEKDTFWNRVKFNMTHKD
ncbi:hypothetical protein [uncultured Flavonifractor sp.]|uniref:hypothetical protein n=1 Tax=uncultured Flavonifractor sp. TaxID=1193534 RepID=UPI002631D1DA|nr:hypothetical protein [uncultured Flavonifractor sp.]